MNFHTDLALERREYCEKKPDDGVIFSVREEKEIKITDVKITKEEGERLLMKPKGTYVTLECEKLRGKNTHTETFTDVLCDEIKKLIPQKGTALIVGLGNSDITPDALGPKCVNRILSTRHIKGSEIDSPIFDSFRSVCALVPGVLGKTGVEASETVSGLCQKIRPDFLIAIDALASRNISRLGTTVQLCDSGISPGSGVGNHRKAIDKSTLGIPVIAIGVPTVVDGATMTIDILEKSGITNIEDEIQKEIEKNGKMLVTPKGIDELISSCAHIIAMAINMALQPGLSKEEISELIS